MGTEGVTKTCVGCGAGYDSVEVYERFKVDYRARVGFAYDGHRPRWIAKFCSEKCRYTEERARTQAHLDRHSARRARERKAGRGDRS